jgi:hypothetical protein
VAETVLSIMQHALGRDEHGQLRSEREYRRHFVAGAGSKEHELCLEAVQNGWMVELPASDLTGGSPIFHVTKDGRQHVIDNSPKPPA